MQTATNLSAVERAAFPNGERLLFVDWNLGNHCHYSCSYCPSFLHDGSVGPPDLADCLDFCRWVGGHAALRAMRPHFHFSGGEPTIYPHFERLIDAVRAKALGSVSIVSNSARPTSWWKRVAPLLNDITFSAHLEYLDIDRFAETIAVAMAKTRVHVNIPAPPELFGEAQAVFDTLTALFPGLSVSMKPILIDFRTELASYNEHQLEKLRTARTNARLSPNSDSVPRPLYLARGGEKFQMGSAAALVASGENHFEGWECQAGVEALAVTLGGDIFRAVCKIGGTIGRLGGKLPEYPIDPVVCDRAVCKCLTDIPIRKRAILR